MRRLVLLVPPEFLSRGFEFLFGRLQALLCLLRGFFGALQILLCELCRLPRHIDVTFGAKNTFGDLLLAWARRGFLYVHYLDYLSDSARARDSLP